MQECPYCGSDLNGSVRLTPTRTGETPGSKSTKSELVTCPDCDEIIDGFTPH